MSAGPSRGREQETVPATVLLPFLAEMQRVVLSLWAARRASRRWPARADFAVEDLRPALGWIMLLTAAERPGGGRPALRYALVGTQVVERVGYDMTGRTTDEFPEPWQSERVNAVYDVLFAAAAPVLCIRHYALEGKTGSHSMLSLPLGTTDEAIDRVMTVQAPVGNEALWSAEQLRRLGREETSQSIAVLDQDAIQALAAPPGA